ncbi:MAG TPA: hypothetical protein VJ798_01645 [Rhizomicrobium sp.]|nr:hypothetical protein [Rhizomicrobium sp.]
MSSRECGTCTLCCKVMGIHALDKPRGVWCSHAMPGQGCAIYETRPEECRKFACVWLADENLGPEWKPEKCKMVLVSEEARKRTMVYVDASMPDAWKRSPYLERLTALMHAGLPLGRLVFIDVGGKVSLMLPDRMEDLGRLGLQDEVVLQMIRYPHATEYKVSVNRG